jgi:hypothetical protein
MGQMVRMEIIRVEAAEPRLVDNCKIGVSAFQELDHAS